MRKFTMNVKLSIDITIAEQVIDRTFDIKIWAGMGRPNDAFRLQRFIKNALDK